MEQREIDNMLLSMIQKHFPSLPLSDKHTDWGKWLGFARAVYEAGRASPASAPEGFALVPVVPTNAILDVMFNAGIDRHDGDLTLLYRAILAAAPTPPVSEDRKDAEHVPLKPASAEDMAVYQQIVNNFNATMQEDKP